MYLLRIPKSFTLFPEQRQVPQLVPYTTNRSHADSCLNTTIQMALNLLYNMFIVKVILQTCVKVVC